MISLALALSRALVIRRGGGVGGEGVIGRGVMVTSDLLLACLGILLDWGEGVIGRGVMVTSVMVLTWLLVILWVRGEGVIGRGVMLGVSTGWRTETLS